MAYITIDSDSLRSWMSANNLSGNKLSAEIGHSHNYISNILMAGRMHDSAYNLFLRLFDLPQGSFVPKPKPKEKPKEKPVAEPKSGYRLELETQTDKVRLTLWFRAAGTDIEVAHAYSRIKGETELDLAQAISYAAHLIYKFVEQDRLAK